MSPTFTRRRGRTYRYYTTQTALRLGADACPLRSVPAAEVEQAVIDQVRQLLRAPEVIVATWRAATAQSEIDEATVRSALNEFDELWSHLFPSEQARIIRLLVQRVDVQLDGVAIALRVGGLSGLVGELRASSVRSAA
jgi:site-specific DNA recombinase